MERLTLAGSITSWSITTDRKRSVWMSRCGDRSLQMVLSDGFLFPQ